MSSSRPSTCANESSWMWNSDSNFRCVMLHERKEQVPSLGGFCAGLPATGALTGPCSSPWCSRRRHSGRRPAAYRGFVSLFGTIQHVPLSRSSTAPDTRR
eukprot:scaffold7615_cov286-Pinguiococcus_pyrenoidosus.AAC.14